MVLALLSLFFGVLSFGFGSHVFAKIRAERAWPTVPGTIVERGVGEAMGQGRVYMPHVKYTYSVAGKDYANDQVYLIRRTGGLRDVIQKLVDGLPATVPVHYDPADPSRSFLLKNPLVTVWLLFGFGVFATLYALAQLLVIWAGSGKP